MDLNHSDQNVLPFKTPKLKAKRQKLRNLQFIFETPEEKEARRIKAAEQVRKFRQRQEALETPEKAAIRRAMAAEKMRRRRKLEALKKLKSNETQVEAKKTKRKKCAKQVIPKTPEEKAAQLLHVRERRKKLRALKLLFETPEEQAIRRMKLANKVREYRRRKRALETPEKAAERQLANQEASKIRRKKHAEQIKLETAEEKAARRNKTAEQVRKHRERQKALETPEQAAIRRAKAAESTRRRKKQALEAQGKSARRYSVKKEAKTTERKKQVMPETPEEKAARRLQNSTQIRKEHHTDEWSISDCTETSFVTQETFQSYTDIDSLLDGSTTKAEFQNKNDTGKRNSTQIQKEHHTDEWSISDCTETSFVTQETFQSYTDIDSLLDGSTTKAEFQNKNDTGKRNSTQIEKEVIKDEFSTFESTETSFVTQQISMFANLNQITDYINDYERSRQPSRRMLCDTENYNSTEISEQINDGRSIFECSETSFTQETFYSNTDFDSLLDGSKTKEILGNKEPKNHEKRSRRNANESLNYMKMLLDAEAKRDEYLVYGEHIAARLRDCYREESEICVAKQLLENILSDLNAGVYSCATTTGVNTQTFETSTTNIS